MSRRPSPRALSIASLAAAGLALGLAAVGRGGPAPEPRQAAKSDAPPTTATAGWSTAESCRICHRKETGGKQPVTDFVRLDEVDIWSESDKHHDGFASLKGERGKTMQERLSRQPGSDWKDITADARCLSCHAPAATEGSKDPAAVVEGVSCVSCHGAYTEWVAAHGALGDRAKQEQWIATPAKVKHEKFGMNDLRDPAVRTRICASCHVGDKDRNRVVTHEMYAAGHPPLPGLEVATFSQAEPPHWWPMKKVPYLNQSDDDLKKKHPNDPAILTRFVVLRKNYKVDEFPTQYAKLVAVGGLVTFREAMQLTADMGEGYDGKGRADFARFDCAACHHELKVWQDSFRQARGYVGDPGRPPAPDWPAALVSVAIEAGDPAKAEARKAALAEGLARYQQAIAKAPFGAPARAVDEARALATWSEDLIKELDSRKLDRAAVLRMLKQIAALDPPDHASARQLAWAFKAVYDELDPKPENAPEIEATISELIKTLGIGLTPGQQGTVIREVGARLDADEKYDPVAIARLVDRLRALVR